MTERARTVNVMTTTHQIYEAMQRIAPLELAESWDNPGLLVDCGGPVEKVLVTLDITPEVVEEAAAKGCSLIVAHHPVIFSPLKKLGSRDVPFQLVQSGISAICMHTNLDAADGGVNDCLAKKLGLNDVFLLNDEKIGRIGTLSCEKGLEEFLRDVIELLGCGGLRYCRGSGRVHRVAVGGGACGEYIPQAIAQGCDTFVTSDLRYNDFLDTRGLNLIDAGHFPTENVVCPTVKAYLEEHFPEVKTVISTSHRDVIQYYL